MAKKYVRGYVLTDISIGMKIRDKLDKKSVYEIIVDIDDVHNVITDIYDKNGKKIGCGFYCFDKKCEYEYYGGKIEILTEEKK